MHICEPKYFLWNFRFLEGVFQAWLLYKWLLSINSFRFSPYKVNLFQYFRSKRFPHARTGLHRHIYKNYLNFMVTLIVSDYVFVNNNFDTECLPLFSPYIITKTPKLQLQFQFSDFFVLIIMGLCIIIIADI